MPNKNTFDQADLKWLLPFKIAGNYQTKMLIMITNQCDGTGQTKLHVVTVAQKTSLSQTVTQAPQYTYNLNLKVTDKSVDVQMIDRVNKDNLLL